MPMTDTAEAAIARLDGNSDDLTKLVIAHTRRATEAVRQANSEELPARLQTLELCLQSISVLLQIKKLEQQVKTYKNVKTIFLIVGTAVVVATGMLLLL